MEEDDLILNFKAVEELPPKLDFKKLGPYEKSQVLDMIDASLGDVDMMLRAIRRED